MSEEKLEYKLFKLLYIFISFILLNLTIKIYNNPFNIKKSGRRYKFCHYITLLKSAIDNHKKLFLFKEDTIEVKKNKKFLYPWL